MSGGYPRPGDFGYLGDKLGPGKPTSASYPMPQPATQPAATPGDPPVAKTAQQPGRPELPFDAGHQMTLSANQYNHDTRMASLAARRALAARQFGAGAGGALDFLDPDDPWSRTAQLNQRFREERQSLTASQFASRRGFDGESEHRDALQFRDQSKARGDLQNEYNQLLAELAGQESAAKGEKLSGDTAADADLLARFMADKNAEVALPQELEEIATGKAPAPASSKKKSQKRLKGKLFDQYRWGPGGAPKGWR